MNNELIDFMRAQAMQDMKSAQDKIVEMLKTVPIGDLKNDDFKKISRLTRPQQIDVFYQCAKEQRRKDRPAKPQKLTAKDVKQVKKRSAWKRIPSALRSPLIATVLCTAIAFGGTFHQAWTALLPFEIGSKPSTSQAWTTCSRLSSYTEHCIYTVQSTTSWKKAALQLQIPVFELQRLNKHIPPKTSFLPKGTRLIVSRETTHKGEK